MKIHLISRNTIEEFALKNARSRTSFEDWLQKLKDADWIIPDDEIATYNSADLLGNGSNRVVFDIAGNNYRMICKYWFGDTRVHLYVKWIGSHAEYTSLCKQNKQFTVDNF